MTISLKAGIAAAAGRLLNEINTFTARGVSGNKLVINVCNSAPQLWPMPITGRGPYSTQNDGGGGGGGGGSVVLRFWLYKQLLV